MTDWGDQRTGNHSTNESNSETGSEESPPNTPTERMRKRTTRTPPNVWVDFASPSHPFFFDALLDGIPEVSVRTTTRKKTETVSIARDLGIDQTIVGSDFDDPRLRKVGIPLRTIQLSLRAPASDVSLSSRNAMCVLASRIRGIPSIHFTDNDITAYVDGLYAEELYHRLEATATYNVVPSAFATEELTRGLLSSTTVRTYDGYKEDVYVATFEPDPAFVEQLPFDRHEYVVVRPEALTATYVRSSTSLVPALLDELVESGIGVVYLPRGRGDVGYAEGYSPDEVFVPERPLNGLQLAWHSCGVLTGSGTMAREAACMGKPAFSFFPSVLLSVDRAMIREGKMIHSRDPAELVALVESATHRDVRPDLNRSQSVRREVVDITTELIDSCTGR